MSNTTLLMRATVPSSIRLFFCPVPWQWELSDDYSDLTPGILKR